MATSKGKEFEKKFAEDWKRAFPEGTLDRIYDSVSGYKSISNVSDFIGYNYPVIYYLECKSHLKNTWNFSYFTQYDKLKDKVGIHGVRSGVVLWMIDHDTVVYLPTSTVTEMKKNGEKSFNIKMLQDKSYNIIVIPSIKKRVYLDSDYTVLKDLVDGE